MAIKTIDQYESRRATALAYWAEPIDFHAEDMQSLDAPERLPTGGAKALDFDYATAVGFEREFEIKISGTLF